MAQRLTVDPPDLPELESGGLSVDEPDGDLDLSGMLIENPGGDPAWVRRIRIDESELHGVALDATHASGLSITDVICRDCELSNARGRGGLVKRVELRQSRLVGLDLSEGTVQDLFAVDCTLTLASFAFAELRSVVFERVNLTEASFMNARLESVEFIDCKLEGADFRGATLSGCTIRGSSLDGILSVESMRGLTMPWADVLASAAALAAAVGIAIESD